MARTHRTHSSNRPTRAGRADRRGVTTRVGQQPSPVWLMTLLNGTLLR